MQGPNGSYDTFGAPFRGTAASTYAAPANSWEAAAIRAATVVMTMPRNQVQRLVKPPLPQIGPRPQHRRPTPGVIDLIQNSGNLYGDYRGYFSGAESGYSGSSRNVNNAF